MPKTASLLFSLLLFAGLCSAQDVKPWQGFGVEVNMLGGKVLKHEAKFTQPIPALSVVTDINFIQHTYGKKNWHQRRRFPTLGVGISYTNYGIDSVYGRAISVYPNIELRLAKGKSFEWTVRLGEGVAYITRIYGRDEPSDTINKAISSHINGYSSVMTDVRWRISDHLDLQAGLNLTHISNSSLRKPNLGVNLYGAHIGLRYFPVTSRPKQIVRELKPLSNRWLINVRAMLGSVAAIAPLGPRHPVYVLSAYGSRRWHSKNKYFAGIDYSYHGDIYAYLRNNSYAIGDERMSASKSGLFIGNEFMLGRFGITTLAGVYIKYAYLKKDDIYEKVGASYYFVQREKGPIKEAYFGIFLKTHLNVAETGEVGFGVGF
ncbi:MAG: acyloxyacyl hydrolase [Bacteroidota bacterium]